MVFQRRWKDGQTQVGNKVLPTWEGSNRKIPSGMKPRPLLFLWWVAWRNSKGRVTPLARAFSSI